MKYTFLSGGTGTPKLLLGFRQIIPDSEISVICNTGDDMEWYGLHVSPDLDTVLYLFAEKLDMSKFWGVKDETFNALNTIKSLEQNVWFNVGDRDLGLHLVRSKFKELTLTEISNMICQQWEIDATIVPMCDQAVRSIIHTQQGKLSFQEYFVKYEWKPKVNNVKFSGDKSMVPPATIELLNRAEKIIIGPSNPVTSIGPMLSLTPLKNSLNVNKDKVIAISPIVSNQAFSGPSVALMKAQNIEVNPIGLAKYYEDLISYLILDPNDRSYAKDIRDLNIEPIFLPIELKSSEQQKQLARSILELF